jgi:hypothetical protein
MEGIWAETYRGKSGGTWLVLRRRMAGAVARVGRFEFSMATQLAALAVEDRKEERRSGEAQGRDKLMWVCPIHRCLARKGRVARA